MPLEGAVVKQHIRINFLDRTAPILDVSFRTGHHMVFIPYGLTGQYLVNPESQLDRGHMLQTGEDVDAVLKPGTPAYRQCKMFFTRDSITDGLVLYPTELPETPAPAHIAAAYAACDDFIEQNEGLGWPYLSFTNLGDKDIPVLNNNAFLSEASSYVGAQERILFLRVPRHPDGNLNVMANAAKTMAISLNSPRTVLLCHDGDDVDLDGHPDAEAFLDANAAGFIASIPVGGWEIFAKETYGLEWARFTNTQRLILENGETGTPGAITATKAFGKSSFSNNKTTAGTFIDITQAKDFLAFKWRQALWLRLRNYNKIPFSYRGFQILYQGVEEVLLTNAEDPMTQVGIVRRNAKNEPEYLIVFPIIEKMALADRVNRHVNPVNVSFKYTGSVLKITMIVVIEV